MWLSSSLLLVVWCSQTLYRLLPCIIVWHLLVLYWTTCTKGQWTWPYHCFAVYILRRSTTVSELLWMALLNLKSKFQHCQLPFQVWLVWISVYCTRLSWPYNYSSKMFTPSLVWQYLECAMIHYLSCLTVSCWQCILIHHLSCLTIHFWWAEEKSSKYHPICTNCYSHGSRNPHFILYLANCATRCQSLRDSPMLVAPPPDCGSSSGYIPSAATSQSPSTFSSIKS